MNMTEDGLAVDRIHCGHCHAQFTPRRRWQRFCSTACRIADWNEMNPRQPIVGKQLRRIEAKIDSLTNVNISREDLIG